MKEKTTDLHLDKQELMNEISEHKNAHERLNEAYINLNNLYQQAVKDTAKEILTELIERAHSNGCIDLTVNEVKAWFREDYNVEVE